MAKKRKTYTTDILNVAAFIMCRGIMYTKITRTSEFATTYHFPNTKEVHTAVKQFLHGNPVVNVNRWLNIRMELKFGIRAVGVRSPRTGRTKNPPSLFATKLPPVPKPNAVIKVGQKYYFRDGSGGVLTKVWGDSETHFARLRTGNVYLSQSDAHAAINALTV